VRRVPAFFDTHFLSVYDSMGTIPSGFGHGLEFGTSVRLTAVDCLVVGTCGAHAFRSHCTDRREAGGRRYDEAFVSNYISHQFSFVKSRERDAVASQCITKRSDLYYASSVLEFCCRLAVPQCYVLAHRRCGIKLMGQL